MTEQISLSYRPDVGGWDRKGEPAPGLREVHPAGEGAHTQALGSLLVAVLRWC